MTLDPSALRHCPQLAALELLVQAAETAIVALCAAHPAIEGALPRDPHVPIECLADHVVDRAFETIDALHRYRLLLDDLERLDRATLSEDDSLF